MKWTEVIKNYPIIQSKYKRKLAAKRRMKAQSGLDETMTTKDMNQIATDMIKVMKENLPADVEKPQTYDDVIKGLKEGNTAELLGFKPNDLSPRAEDTVETTDINYEEQPDEGVEEVVTEEVPVEKPVETSKETNVAAEVGDISRQIAEGFKPLTPIAAPMPQPYNQPRTIPTPKPSPQIGSTKVWDNDISFWGTEKFW